MTSASAAEACRDGFDWLIRYSKGRPRRCGSASDMARTVAGIGLIRPAVLRWLAGLPVGRQTAVAGIGLIRPAVLRWLAGLPVGRQTAVAGIGLIGLIHRHCSEPAIVLWISSDGDRPVVCTSGTDCSSGVMRPLDQFRRGSAGGLHLRYR